MTKQDLTILLECVNTCNQNGLLRLDKLTEVGVVVQKTVNAIQNMDEHDFLTIQKAPVYPQDVPGESEAKTDENAS